MVLAMRDVDDLGKFARLEGTGDTWAEECRWPVQTSAF